jgi:RNA polymerase sigma factor (sigma-70 family)
MLEPIVYIVDDDVAARSGLASLIESAGLRAETFGCAQDFLSRFNGEHPGCLVLEVHLPRMSGFDLQERLRQRGATLPVIVVCGRSSTPTVVRAMKAGAMDFVDKPADGGAMLDLIQRALESDARHRAENREQLDTVHSLKSLSRRERQVLKLVAAGLGNRAIAEELGISIKTVESHRGRVMAKMRVESVAQLVRRCLECEKLRDPDLSCWA